MPKKKGHDNPNLPDTSNLSEEQIEALIAKLNEVPQILAALEAHQEARSKDSKSVASKDNSAGKKEKNRQTTTTTPTTTTASTKKEEEEEEDDEDYDDFDEDADYPCVGDGYSDEVSVMSDMTTPTVVSSLHVDDEEHYSEVTLGYGNQAVKKKKDLLGGVAKGTAAGTTAARRASSISKGSKGSKKSTGGTKTKKKTTKTTKKKTAAAAAPAPAPKKGTGFSEWDTSFDGGGGGWTDFGGTTTTTAKKKAEPVLIDDDGFLVSQNAAVTSGGRGDPFGTTFGTAFPSSSGANAANDFDFGGFDAFKTSTRNHHTTTPKQQPSPASQQANFGLNGSSHSNSKFPSLPPPGTKKAQRSTKVGKSKTTENSINTKPKTSATTRKKVRRASLA